jgi:hypothetical protein
MQIIIRRSLDWLSEERVSGACGWGFDVDDVPVLLFLFLATLELVSSTKFLPLFI